MSERDGAPEGWTAVDELRLRREVYAERVAIERAVFGGPGILARFWLFLMRALGAAAIGLVAAGFSVLAIVVLLNLFFHYAPGTS
jgi:hypothetical protein